MQNAMGFNPLDILGGDSGSMGGGGILPVIGDVVIATDPRVRGIWVRAEAEDMALIAQVIADVIDLPGAPHDVNEIGDTYRIPINHQDPNYVMELVKSSAPSLFESDQQSGGGNNPQAQMQQQMMQQLQKAMQGATGGSSAPEEKVPKATITADTENNALLVTGPEYIARRVEAMVLIIDTPKTPEEEYIDIIDVRGKMNAEQAVQVLSQLMGDKLQSSVGGSSTTGGPSTTQQASSRPGGNTAGRNAATQQAQQLGNIMQMMQRARAGGNTGGRGGGGGRGGNTGGRGGGGGRGGRGG